MLVRQLGPTLERISRLAWHRDVNPRNVLISDGSTGQLLDSTAPKASVSNARFWLIDFGLAVDSRSWGARWSTSAISGDCRYWPTSAWLMWLSGPEGVRENQKWVTQYETKLDSYALGIMALEMLCSPALANDDGNKIDPKTDELRGSWRRLLTAWTKYMRDVTRWHGEIFRVFSSGGDIAPLYNKLSQERAAEVVQHRVATLCSCLRACVDRTHDPAIQNLLWAVSELIDENSNVSLREAVKAVNSEGRYNPQASVESMAHSTSQPATRGTASHRSLTPHRRCDSQARSSTPGLAPAVTLSYAPMTTMGSFVPATTSYLPTTGSFVPSAGSFVPAVSHAEHRHASPSPRLMLGKSHEAPRRAARPQLAGA